MTEKEAHDKYNNWLNTASPIFIANIEFEPARVMRELDLIAYQCAFNDWCDAEEIDTDDLT